MMDMRFTEEALRSMHGKKVPLTDQPGGRVIGEATMRYDEDTGDLMADMTIADPKVAEFLKAPQVTQPSVIFRKDT